MTVVDFLFNTWTGGLIVGVVIVLGIRLVVFLMSEDW